MVVARDCSEVGMRSYYLMGIKFQFYKMKRVLETMVMMAAQYKCTQYHWTGHFNMVKIVSFMLCVFYHSKKIGRKPSNSLSSPQNLYTYSYTLSQLMALLSTHFPQAISFLDHHPGHNLDFRRHLVHPVFCPCLGWGPSHVRPGLLP